MQVWNVLTGGSLQIQDPKNCQKIAIWAPSHNFVGLYLRNEGTHRQSEKKLVKQQCLPTCSHNTVNFGLLAGWDLLASLRHPANFNGLRVLAALLHGTLVVGVSQTLRHWTEGATYIRQGGHHVGHWPTFLVKRTVTLKAARLTTKWAWNSWNSIAAQHMSYEWRRTVTCGLEAGGAGQRNHTHERKELIKILSIH